MTLGSGGVSFGRCTKDKMCDKLMFGLKIQLKCFPEGGLPQKVKKTPSKKSRMNPRSTLHEFDEWNKATVTPNLLRQVC